MTICWLFLGKWDQNYTFISEYVPSEHNMNVMVWDFCHLTLISGNFVHVWHVSLSASSLCLFPFLLLTCAHFVNHSLCYPVFSPHSSLVCLCLTCPPSCVLFVTTCVASSVPCVSLICLASHFLISGWTASLCLFGDFFCLPFGFFILGFCVFDYQLYLLLSTLLVTIN